MKFHLNYTPAVSPQKLSHNDSVVLIGSCFSDNIGERLIDHKFSTLVNPGGILFNPLSIHNFIFNCVTQSAVSKVDFISRESTQLSFFHHSSITALTENELKSKIEKIRSKTFDAIKKADFLIITFGTAFYYFHIQLNQVVANCHKQDAKLFDKKLLTISEIVAVYNELIKLLLEINPTLNIIFTVSPVKHLRDGVEENSISKSTLLLSIRELTSIHSSCLYFPAYELVNDDLRDYRFYEEDLAHPNELAIQYIWAKFANTFFSEKTREINKFLNKMSLACAHRLSNDKLSTDVKLEEHLNELKNNILKIAPDFDFKINN